MEFHSVNSGSGGSGGSGGGYNPFTPQAITLTANELPTVQPGLVVITGASTVGTCGVTLGSDGLYEIDATGATGVGTTFGVANIGGSSSGMMPGDHLHFQVKGGIISYAKGFPCAQGAYNGITNTQISENNCTVTGAGGTDGRYPQIRFNRPMDNENYVVTLGLSYGSTGGERIVFTTPGGNTVNNFSLITLEPNGPDASTDYVSFVVYPA